MVLGHFGRRIDAAWLRRILESTPIGTPGFKVRNLERHGYFVTYAPATDERVLMDALHRGIPPIVLLLTTNLSYWDTETAHAVVVVGMDDDMVMLNDPEFPQEIQHVPIDEFMLAWSDFDWLYALIQPKA